MTPEERRAAILALVAARLELEITDQHLKKMGVMRNHNTLTRVLKGNQDYRLSTLIEAAAGVNCEVEIIFKRTTAA